MTVRITADGVVLFTGMEVWWYADWAPEHTIRATFHSLDEEDGEAGVLIGESLEEPEMGFQRVQALYSSERAALTARESALVVELEAVRVALSRADR